MTTVVFDSEFQPSVVAVAFAGDRYNAALVAVLHQESDGSILVGEPSFVGYAAMYSQEFTSCFGGLFTYWVEPHELSKFSSPIYGPELSK